MIGAHSITELVAALKRPRRVMMMVKAGTPVDELIAELLPHLEKGDILIDGGNSLFDDTSRRTKDLEAKGFYFIGTGVSGGEEGARRGPSIMPGGSKAAWPHVKDIFQGIAAKVEDGTPCCDWVGEFGAGHYVKMVHNGIEYGDMQLICEAYQLMKDGLGMTPDEMSAVFAEWNKTELDSFLIEITSHILAFKDTDGQPLVNKILDTAGQKGTGKWTVISSSELGIPITLIAEAVYSRCVSALKEERVAASKKLRGPKPLIPGDRKTMIEDIRLALYASKMVSYAQGYMLMRAAAHGERLESQLRWRGPDVARRLHYSQPFFGQDQGRVRPHAQAGQSSHGQILSRRNQEMPAVLAQGRRPGGGRREFPRPPFPPRSAFTTATAPKICPPTCSRPSAITSARTPMSEWTSRAASFSTAIGPGTAARRRPAATTFDFGGGAMAAASLPWIRTSYCATSNRRKDSSSALIRTVVYLTAWN